jgi:hypothetical protein
MVNLTNTPFTISEREWEEILRLKEVREAWGLTDETAEEFASRVYGVKFDFVSGSPGYCGDLYILQGDAISDTPMMIGRREGKLEDFEF